MNSRIARSLCLLACACAALAAYALERQQFVAGWPLELPQEGGVFDVALPREVYEHAASIEQVAVLDAAGEPMPFYRVGAPAPAMSERRLRLEASGLYASSPGRSADVRVVTEGERTDVSVTSPRDAREERPTGFVIDARGVDFAPVALEIEWAGVEQPFLIDVAVEHGESLSGWRVVGRGPVAALVVDGTESRHTRVPVRAPPGGYYRIASSSAVPQWTVRAVTLVGAEPQAPPARRSVLLAPLREPPRDGVADALYFDAGGPLPIDAVALAFGARNGWARAAVASAASLAGPWRQRAPARLFYAVEYEGRRFASLPADVGRGEDRYWRLVFEGGVPSQPVELEAGYSEERLRFAAQGSPPYLLAAGTVADAAGPDRTFEAVWNSLPPAERRSRTAVVGARIELGGPAALAQRTPFPWRTAGLWAVLALGVLAVALMAVRLGREMLSGKQGA